MSNVKTAISINTPLFKEANDLATEMEISRSHLFSLAVQEFIQRYKNRKILEAINAAYNDLPDSQEEILLKQMHSQHSKQVKDQW